MIQIANKSPKFRDPDCTCLTCDRDIHHLGIMSHRAMHRRKEENCRIAFSDGRIVAYTFERKKP